MFRSTGVWFPLCVSFLLAGCAIAGCRPPKSLLPVGGSLLKSESATAPSRHQRTGVRGRVLFFYCACGACTEVARLLRTSSSELRSRLLGITGLNPAESKAFQTSAGLRLEVLPDPVDVLKNKYGVPGCPAVIALDPDGKVTLRWQSGMRPLSLKDLR
jgi:peroxiredoxin